MENLEKALRQHPFLQHLSSEQVKLVTGCAKSVRFASGEFLAREGDRLSGLYLIRDGVVAIETHEPGGRTTCIETLMSGDVMGISWVASSRIHFDCRAREPVSAFSLERECLQKKMDRDAALGYAITSRLLDNTYQRLSRIRLQNLDVYR